MKKLYKALICLLILALVVCGCSKADTNTTENTDTTDTKNEVAPADVDISLLDKDTDAIAEAFADDPRWCKSDEYFDSHPESNIPNFADETDGYILLDNSEPVDTGLGIYISIPEELQDDVLVEYRRGIIQIHDVSGEAVEYTEETPPLRDVSDGCVRILRYDAVSNDRILLSYGKDAMTVWATDDGSRGAEVYTQPEEYVRVLDSDYPRFKDKYDTYTDEQVLSFVVLSDKIDDMTIRCMDDYLEDGWVYTYYDVENDTEMRIEK